MDKNYIFKLTPNKKDVIINTEALLNGYMDVSYPIPLKQTSQLGYVLDPDTFKFSDNDTIQHQLNPYPIKMEIEPIFEIVPFYGLNNKISNDKILFYIPSWTYNGFIEKEDHDMTVFTPSVTGTLANDEGYSVSFEIRVRVYWSDNKPHSSTITDWLYFNPTIGTYPFNMNIIYTKLIDDNLISFNKQQINIPTDLNNTQNPFITVSDSDIESVMNIINFNFSATFTDPTTMVSVNSNANINVQQAAFLGYKQGYVTVKFTDTIPLEVWSPTISYTFAKSNNNEANKFLDKKALTEYNKIIISGNFDSSKDNYDYFTLYESGFLPYYVLDDSTNDLTNNTLNGRGLTDSSIQEELEKLENSKFNGKLSLYDIKIDHYYTDDFIQNHSLYTDSSLVYNSKDCELFKYRFNNIINTPLNNDTSIFKITETDDSDNSESSLNIIIKKTEIKINTALYKARYATYCLDENNKYHQILDEIKQDGKLYYIIAEDTSNHDILDISNFLTVIDIEKGEDQNIKTACKNFGFGDGSSRGYKKIDCSTDIENEDTRKYKITDYKIIYDNDKAVQYKYCVNNIFNEFTYQYKENETDTDVKYKKISVQMPRFAVYPILGAQVAIKFRRYDYTTPDIIPYQDLTEYTDLVYRENGKLKPNTEKISEILATPVKQVFNIIQNNNIINSNTAIFNDNTMVGPSIPKANTIPGNTVNTGTVINTGGNTGTNTGTIGNNTATPIRFGAGESESYTLEILQDNIPDILMDKIRINGVLLNKSYFITSNVKPYIFTISLDDYPLDVSACLKVTITSSNNSDPLTCSLILTNDENEKHLVKYNNEGKDINNNHSSFMLLRANPKLSGNVKLVIDSKYNLYLDTFKVSAKLNDYRFRKYPISADGNYPRDVKTVFKNLPIAELYKINDNAFKPHKVYTDFGDQYDTVYEYGAETNTDNLYNENMKILAPLHIGDNIPQFFAIFRYDDIFNEETYNGLKINDFDKFDILIRNSKIIKTFDLRQYTSIGQYLNNYKDMLSNYGQCYLQFIEQDYDIQSQSYRQGNNIWKGISVQRGILTDQSETSYFAAKLLNDEKITNKQEVFNNFIMTGFERHHLLYPNIINLEFMFNDEEKEEYSMHRYFGLYLTENDFINYSYIISNNQTYNNIFQKYDVNGNIYQGDVNIFNIIFTEKYNNRIFYGITNDYAFRVQSEIDVNNFLNNYVKNLPEKNLTNIKSDRINYENTDKSFITLHFSEPIKYGEHFKFIAMNRQLKNKVYTNVSDTDVKLNVLPYEHIVYEIIASNDERLRTTDHNISPYVNTQSCVYSDNTYFVRMSFYTQDVNYPEVTATLSDQIKRIVHCIEKFDTFIKVSSYNNMSLAVISEHPEMYFQHIAAVDLTDFKYDYVNWTNITGDLITTNTEYTDSIDFMNHQNIIDVSHYIQADDKEHDWLSYLTTEANDENWRHYIEVEDPYNIKYDSLSYFNKDTKYKMFALSNQSDYFDSYYTAFSNYNFETLGWRYNNIVKFINIDNLKNSYVVYDDIYEFVKDIKFPLVQTSEGSYETVMQFNINYGYLRNNIYDPDLYEAYTSKQQIIYKDDLLLNYVMSPYDINHVMLCSVNEVLQTNNYIRLYKPKSANIAIMGISNIKDIDMNLDIDLINHQETNLTVYIPAGTTIAVDESDYRIQHGVMYQIIDGNLYYDGRYLNNNEKFIIIRNNYKQYIYISSSGSTPIECKSLYAKTNVIYKICDKQIYQDYNYDTSIPCNKTDNFYYDLINTETSDLVYPIVPQVQCNWKSNGQYLDHNNILDVKNLGKDYETIGHFIENVYTPSDFGINQYVTNKIDNILYVNGKQMTYKDCILSNAVQYPIKQLLIDRVNIDTAFAYYNPNIQSLEFIFSGIKFNIKLNSKIVNTYIHLDDYTGFQVFVINEYDVSKRNELYISYIEKSILLVNHQFYIDYEHEAVSNIKILEKDVFQEYAPYSAFKAPYSLDFRTTALLNKNVISHKKDNIILKSLVNTIDQYNLWNSLFTQYDVPVLNEQNNDPMFIQSYIEAINEYDDYITIDSAKSDIGILNSLTVVNTKNDTVNINTKYSQSYPYVITKADGDYNHSAYILLETINERINSLISLTDKPDILVPIKDNTITIDDGVIPIHNTPIRYGVKQSSILIPATNNLVPSVKGILKNNIKNSNSMSIHTAITNKPDNVALNEELMKLRLENTNKNSLITYLTDMLNTPIFRIFLNLDRISDYKNVLIPKKYLNELQEYIKLLITKESDKEKLERYISTFDNNIDIYIIPENTDVKYIKNTNEYNPLLFELSIPNRIKYNYGWFTPNTNNMLDFYINDELKDILNVELLQANTLIKDIHSLLNYSGNKVFEDTKLQTVNKNYFLIPERSLLSSTWDYDYYRKYTSENNYEILGGQITGIDDKSFFGSRCMVIHEDYIELNTWLYDTANDIYTVKITDSKYNLQNINTQSYQISINLSAALYNHFINNKIFKENWNYFKEYQVTGMKNYINNTISVSYNMNSNIDIKLYYIDTDINQIINMLNERPNDLEQNYKIYEGYSTQINLKNNIYTLNIIIPKVTGMNIYPIVKIYRK